MFYDIGEIGEMHHNHKKNVLHVASSLHTIGQKIQKTAEEVRALIFSAEKKMYAARLKRPTPYVDKTVYVSWNAHSRKSLDR